MSTDTGRFKARWPEVSQILDRLLEISTDQRAEFIEREIGDDAELRQIVERLLDADQRGSQFLGASAKRLASSLLEHTPEAIVDRLDRFEILDTLGSGGMGQVFEARDRQLKRLVAIKVLIAAHALNDNGRERFLREARAASSVDHPNICTVHDIGEVDGHLYIVMSRYHGETLESRLQEGPVELRAALEITRQVTLGLACAHRSGVVHRDIKPANILLTAGEEVKILDFGIAKVLGASRLTCTDANPGTLAYMAPELIEGQEADARSDLWSVGVVLYQLLSGQLPFGKHGLVGATVNAILHTSLPSLVEPKVPEAIEQLLEKVLEKHPSDRFENAEALLAALDALEGVEPPPRPLVQRITPAAGRGMSKTALAVGGLVMILIILLVYVEWGLIGAGPKRVGESLTVMVEEFEDRNTESDTKSDLAWLGPAIASMLSCDLAQVESLEVSSGCGFSARLAPLVAAPSSEPSAGVTGGSHRVKGWYLAIGGRLRLDISVLLPSGEQLGSKVLQRDQEEIFELVADASGFVRGTLGVPASETPWLAGEATSTASFDAWRHYQIALELYREGRRSAAIEELERAIEADPEFALALADLGVLYTNAGDLATARKYLARARRQGHRLPSAQRDHVEAEILASTWEGAAAAADILERQILQQQDDQAARNNLAMIYGGLEDYERAAVLFDSLMTTGTEHSGSWEAAVSVAVALDDFARAHSILDELPPDVANDWRLRWKRGWVWLEQGEFGRAWALLADLVAEDEAAFLSRYELWRLAAAEEKWREALAWSEAIVRHAVRDGRAHSFEAWWGEVASGRTHLFLGDAAQALAAFARASAIARDPAYEALGHCLSAEVALALDRPIQGRDLALRALDRGEEQWPWLQGTALFSLAEERLDNSEVADAALDRLVRRALNDSNRPELRLSERLAGQLAFARDDHPRAVSSFRRAVAHLPPRGIEFHPHHLPDHVAVWFELGLAEARAGNLDEARARLNQVLDSGVQKVQAPLAWVRSLYYLGELEAARGNDAEARSLYRRFLELRQGSTLDTDLVARTPQDSGT